MPRLAVLETSLANHLALAVCRIGKGNDHLFNELIKAVYLTYYLQQAGFGELPVEVFRRAEAGMQDAFARAHDEEIWSVDHDTARVLEGILAVHDEQIMFAARWNITDAGDRLTRFVEGSGLSPLPSAVPATNGFDDVDLTLSQDKPSV